MDIECSTALSGLAVAVEAGWLRSPGKTVNCLECTCFQLCLKTRSHVLRVIKVTDRTPSTLWSKPREATLRDRNTVRAKRTAEGISDDQITPPASSILFPTFSVGVRPTATKKGRRGSVRALGRGSRNRTSPGLYIRVTSQKLEGGQCIRRTEYLPGTAATTGESPSTSSKPATSRIPTVCVAGLIWCRNPQELLPLDFPWPEGMTRLTLEVDLKGSLRDVSFPDSLEELHFLCHKFIVNKAEVRWPRGLKRLTLEGSWNMRFHASRGAWPETLESLACGTCFNQPLGGDVLELPSGLREFSLGVDFNQSLEGVRWPPRLEKLVLSHRYNQSLSQIPWSTELRELRELVLGDDFNCPVDRTSFPRSLQTLAFGKSFNQPLRDWVTRRIYLPNGLRKLRLGSLFSWVQWSNTLGELPRDLRELECLGVFWIPDFVQWPLTLTSMHCARILGNRIPSLPPKLETLISPEFDGIIDRHVLPATLKTLKVSIRFRNPADSLPDGIEELLIKPTSNVDVRGRHLPQGLKRLRIECSLAFNKVLAEADWPPCLEELHLQYTIHLSRNSPLKDITLPQGLRVLSFGSRFAQSLRAIELPETLERIVLPPFYPPTHLHRQTWPRCMGVVQIGDRKIPFVGKPGDQVPVEFIPQLPPAYTINVHPVPITRVCDEEAVIPLVSGGRNGGDRSTCFQTRMG